MDSRAGAASEASDAGAQIEDISRFMTHANTQTTKRYMRRTLEQTTRVAKARLEHRERAVNDAAATPLQRCND